MRTSHASAPVSCLACRQVSAITNGQKPMEGHKLPGGAAPTNSARSLPETDCCDGAVDYDAIRIPRS